MDVIAKECSTYYFMLRLAGLVPYANSFFTKIHRTVFLFILFSCLAIQIFIVIPHASLANLFVASTFSCPIILFFCRYIGFIYTVPMVRRCFNSLQNDYLSFKNPVEVGILLKQFDVSRRMILAVLCVSIAGVFYIYVVFSVPVMLDLLMPLNVSRPRMLHSFGFLLDGSTYVDLVALHVAATCTIGVVTLVCTESTLVILVHYICGLYKIVNYRLRCAIDEAANLVAGSKESTLIHLRICEAVEAHRKAMDFVKQYSQDTCTSYLITIVTAMVSLALNLYRLFSAIISMDDYKELIMSVVFVSTHLAIAFLCNMVGQLVINSSTELFYETYNSNWYCTPVTMQKMLLLIMLRSSTDCKIDLSGLFVPCCEGFGIMMSTSFSYFTMLYSLSS